MHFKKEKQKKVSLHMEGGLQKMDTTEWDKMLHSTHISKP